MNTLSIPRVAIVGRPNVGKSALFNRIAQRRISIVEEVPGVTRDRIYAASEWQGRPFLLIDTGGIDVQAEGLGEQVRRQAEIALHEADAILFVVDAQVGLAPSDLEVAEILRRSGKPVVIAANKADNLALDAHAVEFYALGLGDPIPVAAIHGRNVGDLLDAVCARLPAPAAVETDEGAIRVGVIGRPNVGKSSLVNRILGEERQVISPEAGTTRDAVDTPFVRNETRFIIVDTAGIRRPGRVEEGVEQYSVLRALRAIERSDVCCALLDATTGVLEQDKRIAGYAHEAGRGMVLVVNKWDLVEKDGRTMQEYEARLRAELAFLRYAPIVFISAATGQRVGHLLDVVESAASHHALRLTTGQVNEVLQRAVGLRQPPSHKGVQSRLHYGFQERVKPPTFTFFGRHVDLIHFAYRRYLDHQLREAFGFVGTPIWMHFKERAGDHSPRRVRASALKGRESRHAK